MQMRKEGDFEKCLHVLEFLENRTGCLNFPLVWQGCNCRYNSQKDNHSNVPIESYISKNKIWKPYFKQNHQKQSLVE